MPKPSFALTRTTISLTVVFLAALNFPRLVSAQDYSIPFYTDVPSLITGGMLNQMTLDASLRNQEPTNSTEEQSGNEASGTEEQEAQPAVNASSTVLAPRSPTFPAKLALSYPPEQRPQAQQLFTDLLTGFGQIEEQFDLPQRDFATAVAGFIAGSWMAYHNTSFPDQNFKPMVSQLREIISRDPQFASATSADKQETYEQLAILGMFMATNQMALQQNPDPVLQAKMQQAAQGYLEQFLNVDADRLQIGPDGIVIR